MADDLTTALELAEAPQDARNVFDLIGSMEHELVRSLQSPEAAAILARHYTNAVRYNETLRQCTPASLVGALLLSAQCRLEPGPLGHVYLIPFKNKGVYEVTWMLGYTGIVELGRRGGAVGLRATVVWDADEYVQPWENEKGLHYSLVPGDPSARGERVGVLVTWKEAGERMGLHCPVERVERARKASKAHAAGTGPWFTDEDSMWRKTGVRFARPWLPLTTELATADRADDAVVSGVDEGRPILTEADDA